MKLKFIIILLGVINSSIANASLIKIEFMGFINELHESIKNLDSTGYTHINKSQSFMLGDPITLGDMVNGWLIYDTLATETDYSKSQTTYNNVKIYNAITSWGYSVAGYNVYESGVSEGIQIWDNSDCCNWDVFYANAGIRAQDFFTNMVFKLYDKTGSAFSSLDIPDNLSIDNFHLHEVQAGYIPNGSQDQLHWTADISTMEVTMVPEPATIYILMLALICIARMQSLNVKYRCLQSV